MNDYRVETGVYKRTYADGSIKYIAISSRGGNQRALSQKCDTVEEAREAYRIFSKNNPVKTESKHLKDLKGERFGKLLVIDRAKSKNGSTMWLCKCDCGNETVVSAHNLRRGATTTCGSAIHKTARVKAMLKYGKDAVNKYGTVPEMLTQKRKKSNRSGYKGVTVGKNKKGEVRYRAFLTVAGKSYRGHRYKSAEEAYEERKMFERAYQLPILRKFEDDQKK